MTNRRLYNLYLANYRTYCGKRHLWHVIQEYGSLMPPGILRKLIQINDGLTPIHEIEKNDHKRRITGDYQDWEDHA